MKMNKPRMAGVNCNPPHASFKPMRTVAKPATPMGKNNNIAVLRGSVTHGMSGGLRPAK